MYCVVNNNDKSSKLLRKIHGQPEQAKQQPDQQSLPMQSTSSRYTYLSRLSSPLLTRLRTANAYNLLLADERRSCNAGVPPLFKQEP